MLNLNEILRNVNGFERMIKNNYVTFYNIYLLEEHTVNIERRIKYMLSYNYEEL